MSLTWHIENIIRFPSKWPYSYFPAKDQWVPESRVLDSLSSQDVI